MQKAKYTATLLLTILIHISPLLWRGAGGDVQAQTYQWAHGFGGPNYDSQGNSIATDAQGNVYVTGTFGDSIDFDPDTGSAFLYPNNFGMTAFIAKYDSSGNYIWAKSLSENPYGESITEKIVVNNNGIYLTGHFFMSIDFDPGPGNATLSSIGGLNGDDDIFIAHYDLNGNYLWAKSMGGLNEEQALDMALDNSNNIYITGYFKDTADFDPGVGVVNLVCDTITDCFFAKYDNNGNFLWAHDLCDLNGTRSIGLAISLDYINNDFYITGSFHGTIDFDRGAGTYNITDSVFSRYIAKYNSAGAFIWAGVITTTGNLGLGVGSIIVNTGNLYVCGSFSGASNFDLMGGALSLNALGYYDIFFAKYGPNGNNLWIKQLGSNGGSEHAACIQTDNNGNVYIAGNFCPTTDFDPSNTVVNLPVNGSSDMYFSKYDSAGNYVWVKGMGGISTDVPIALTIDGLNNQYITGFFSNSMDFDPGPGVAILNPAQSQNIFIAKYGGTSTGINDIEENKDSNLKAYPNPAACFITLSGSLAFKNGLMRIIDYSGKIVVNTTYFPLQRIDISKLTPGLYMIEVNNGMQLERSKFIKQ